MHIFPNALAHLLLLWVAFPFFICDLSFKSHRNFVPPKIPHRLNSPSHTLSLQTDSKISLYEAVYSKITCLLHSQSLPEDPCETPLIS